MAGGGRDVRPLLPVGGVTVLVVVLIGLAMLAAAFGNPSIEALPGRLTPTTGAPQQEQPDPESSTVAATASETEYASSAPSGLPTSLTFVLAGLLAVAAAALAWWLWRGRASVVRFTAVPEAEVRRRVWGAVDEGLEALAETDGDPRRAVIACWTRLEEAAAAAGTYRTPGDTSTDLVLRLLSAHQVSADVLAEFAAVYRQARFATHAVDDGMREQARAALRQLRDELAAEVTG